MVQAAHPFGMTRRRFLLNASAMLFASLNPFPIGLAYANPISSFSSRRLSITKRGTLSRGGRDIVLIPGLASGPAIWSSLLSRLEGHRLHLVHINGFAKRAAEANAAGALLKPLTDELARYVETQNLHAPVIIGHSMGGTLALMLGLRLNNRVGQLIILDMLPDGSAMVGGTAQGFGYLAGQLNGYLTGTRAGRQILTDMLRETPEGRDSDPHVIAQALTEIAQTDLSAQLKRLTIPLTVIPALPGKTDLDAAQLRRYRLAYSGVRQAKIIGVGPSGHMLMQDQPGRLATIIRTIVQ